jgi:hypothetical protein
VRRLSGPVRERTVNVADLQTIEIFIENKLATGESAHWSKLPVTRSLFGVTALA